MISFLSSWVKNLSLSLIIVSILEMILPNSKTKKYIKMIMGIYILFNIIYPFIENSNFNIENVNIEDYYEVSETEDISSIEVDQTSMYVRLGQIYEEQLEKDITEKLEEKGYAVESCKVTANISQETNESTIEKIVLKLKVKQNNETEEESNQNDISLENRIVTEIENIKKVEVKVSDEQDKYEVEQESASLTKSDKEEIKKFLIEEYGVSEKCLRIS